MTGGGLSLDGERGIGTKPDYLFPVKALAKTFRGKMREALAAAHEQGDLQLPAELASFDQLDRQLRRKDWVVYCKPPLGGAAKVYRYYAEPLIMRSWARRVPR